MAVLEQRNFAQIGFLVHDIEESKKQFARLFGVEEPETVSSGEYEVTKTVYLGKPAPDAECKMAFFHLTEGVQLELIEPGTAPSAWRDYLDQHGEGMHHIAFHVNGMEKCIEKCKEKGMTLLQSGEYNDASGRYAYLDGLNKYKCVMELLESCHP